jgi:twitching motility two-component system response regulator PilH
MMAAAVAAPQPTPYGQSPTAHLTGKRSHKVAVQKILLVDDSPTELAVLSALLQQEGYEVVTARDGEDALDKLDRERPRLVLLDVVMPGKNGFSLCRQIRGMPDFGQVPIILVTSKNQPSDRFWGLKQGANEYVTKPWDPAELVETVRRHL